jgi:hypothetical protein
MTKERTAYWAIIATLIILLLLQRQCAKPCNDQVPAKTDTVFADTKDTSPVYRPSPVTTIKKPKPSKASPGFSIVPEAAPFIPPSGPYGPMPVNPMPFPGYHYAPMPIPLELGGVPEEVISVYSDTLRLPNPAHGYFVVQDTVDGIIRSRQIIRNFSVPVAVHHSYTPARTKLYVGAEILGSKQTFLNYGGVSVGIMTRKDVFYEIKALGPLNGGPALFGIGVKTKISLRGR